MVSVCGIQGQQFLLLDPARAVEAKHIRGAGVTRPVVQVCPDHGGVARASHGVAEVILGRTIRGQ